VATQYASAPCKLTISSYLFARWHLFRHVGYLRHQQQVDLWPFDLESGVLVTCDVGYLCANFVFLGLSVLQLGPMYATDRRQTSDRRQTKASLNASALWRRRHNNQRNCIKYLYWSATRRCVLCRYMDDTCFKADNSVFKDR